MRQLDDGYQSVSEEAFPWKQHYEIVKYCTRPELILDFRKFYPPSVDFDLTIFPAHEVVRPVCIKAD